MLRSRGSSEMSNQRQSSPRVPLHLKSTAASEANSLHRLSTERSSSPRSRPPPEKKRSTRVATLETKLGQTQEELKKVKDQLAAAEAAKHNIQQELEDAKKQIPVELDQHQPEIVENESDQSTEQDTIEPEPPSIEPPISVEPPATDVFEVVPPAFVATEPEEEPNKELAAEEELEMETMVEDEASNLKSKLAEKEKELELSMTENLDLKKQAAEAAEGAAAAKAAAGELSVKLHCMEEELGVRKAETVRLRELLTMAEGGMAAAEAEMKKVKAQAEQWRKAAEAAAAVLAADGERVERCVSMEKNGSGYGPRWSPVVEEGGGRRKGGIRMFGDLWKKKGQHK